jgi:uncharacterized membrane protein YjdF
MPWMLFVIIYVLLGLHITAEIFHLYWIFPWFDLLTHFIGGVWIGYATVWFLYGSKYITPRLWAPKKAFLYILISVLSIGILWELYEIIVHLIEDIPFEMGYLQDTCMDIVMDTLGAVSAYVFSVFFSKRRSISI